MPYPTRAPAHPACQTPCPTCRGTALSWLYDNGSGHQVFACRPCGVALVDSAQPVALIRDEDYYSADMEALYRANRERFAETARHYVRVVREITGELRGRRLLDVGAGLGFFLDEARAAGAAGEGLDIRSSATRFLRERGYPAYTALLHDHAAEAPTGPYDVVTAWNVIEHDDDPRRFVTAAHALLKPGGWLVLETPDNFHLWKRAAYRYFQVVPPDLRPVLRNLHTVAGHRCGFSSAGARGLLEAAGFTRCREATVPYDAMLTIRKVLTRTSSTPRKLATAAGLALGFAAFRLTGTRNRFVVGGTKAAGAVS